MNLSEVPTVPPSFGGAAGDEGSAQALRRGHRSGGDGAVVIA